MRLFYLCLMFAALSSCTSSLVYSPAVVLSNKPLEKDEVDFEAAFEGLPETMPFDNGRKLSSGLSGRLAYGFTDNFSLQLSECISLVNEGEISRHGTALAGIININLEGKSTLMLVPKVGISLIDADIKGIGVNFNAIYHYQLNDSFSFYGGVGGLWGRATKIYEDMPHGFAITTPLGSSIKIFDRFRLNIELVPLYQINLYNDYNHFTIAPHIGFGYTL